MPAISPSAAQPVRNQSAGAARQLWCAGLLLAAATALPGCGGIAYLHAAAQDHQRVQRQHRDCPVPGRNGLCDREFVMVTAAPRQMDAQCLGPTGCPETPRTHPAETGDGQCSGMPGPTPATVRALRSARSSVELARVLLPMAYLSNVVYHRHEVGQPMAVRSAQGACLRQQPMSTHPLELPANLGGGWSRWADPAGCAAEEGLFYDTFLRAAPPGATASAPLQVAIVFRGTENTADQRWHDWTDNFTSAFGLSPRQYTLAIDHLQATMASLDALKRHQAAAGRTVEIYAVGHSLGGGLAQQAAYMYREIDAAIVFNTSAVTNWTQLALWDGGAHICNHDPVVFRVEQQGEFLDYLRFVTTRASSRMLGRTDIEFNFANDGPVGGHSIATLACHLAVRAAEAADETAGPLGHSPAEAALLARPSAIQEFICDADTLAGICTASSPTLPRLAARCTPPPR